MIYPRYTMIIASKWLQFIPSIGISIFILAMSVTVLSAQGVLASPGLLSKPYTPPGQQVQLIAYHSSEHSGETPTLTFPILSGEQLYSYTSSIHEAKPVATAQYSSTMVTVPQAALDCCYFTARPDRIMMTREYYWIFDYDLVSLRGLSLTADYDARDLCDQVVLNLSREPSPIYYITPQGVKMQADRGLTVRYQDLVYDEQRHAFTSVQKDELLPETAGRERLLLAPLSDTSFAIIGDRFTADGLSQRYGLPIESPVLMAHRVEVHARYRPLNSQRDSKTSDAANAADDKDIAQLPSTLSAPAPVEIDLVANEPVAAFYQILITEGTTTSDGAHVVMQFNGRNAQYTFSKTGSYTMYAKTSDRSASCAASSQPVVVSVQSSRLDIPNVFTPFSSPGVNDLFQVVHRSLVSFDAQIFDAWGGLIYRWSDPDGGWDGTSHGRPLPSGAYYYIITAEGADGIHYNERGHINILDSDHTQ